MGAVIRPLQHIETMVIRSLVVYIMVITYPQYAAMVV